MFLSAAGVWAMCVGNSCNAFSSFFMALFVLIFEMLCIVSFDVEESTFADNRKVILSLTSPLSVFYATSRNDSTIHLMPYQVHLLFLRVYRLHTHDWKREIVHKKLPIPYTTIALTRTDLTT
jgi:hypothetical protein